MTRQAHWRRSKLVRIILTTGSGKQLASTDCYLYLCGSKIVYVYFELQLVGSLDDHPLYLSFSALSQKIIIM